MIHVVVCFFLFRMCIYLKKKMRTARHKCIEMSLLICTPFTFIYIFFGFGLPSQSDCVRRLISPIHYFSDQLFANWCELNVEFAARHKFSCEHSFILSNQLLAKIWWINMINSVNLVTISVDWYFFKAYFSRFMGHNCSTSNPTFYHSP